MRINNRQYSDLRSIQFERNYTKHAEGSVLVSYGDTKVLCNASVEFGVPRFLRPNGQKNATHGWLTAEYSMLPRATHDRNKREATIGKQTGRNQEIQRLIGRCLRNCVDLYKLGEYTITIDCDVLQADGSTRTASISGACLALYDALEFLKNNNKLKENPFKYFIAGVSVGILNNNVIVDLDYKEDYAASTDLNLIFNEFGKIIEIQGTAEKEPFEFDELNSMIDLGKISAQKIIQLQKNNL